MFALNTISDEMLIEEKGWVVVSLILHVANSQKNLEWLPNNKERN